MFVYYNYIDSQVFKVFKVLIKVIYRKKYCGVKNKKI